MELLVVVMALAFVWFAISCFHRIVNGMANGADWAILIVFALVLFFTVR